jgi:hypothetical protein
VAVNILTELVTALDKSAEVSFRSRVTWLPSPLVLSAERRNSAANGLGFPVIEATSVHCVGPEVDACSPKLPREQHGEFHLR